MLEINKITRSFHAIIAKITLDICLFDSRTPALDSCWVESVKLTKTDTPTSWLSTKVRLVFFTMYQNVKFICVPNKMVFATVIGTRISDI